MMRQAKVVLIVLSLVAMIAGAQSRTGNQSMAKKTQALGYWMDPSTGLMWTAKDNGYDISWRNSMKHCQNLRLAGYSDWRLPSIDELQNIYDGSGFTAPHPKDVIPVLAGRAKGGGEGIDGEKFFDDLKKYTKAARRKSV